jgi:tRNA A-37 threonylcarbamoyl transferase component Bud32
MTSSVETLGRYQVVRKLATGGMAELFLARAPDVDRQVVVKRILPEHGADGPLLARFLAEARQAMGLHHQNIVEVFEVVEEAPLPFLVMEHLDGQDAATLLSRKKSLPIADAVSIVAGACAGLHYAHEQGIVHRDLSPENLFVTSGGGVKLLDFGLARAAEGKLPYQSPEQRAGGDVDRRSDVYAAGVVLFELTTGERPTEDKRRPSQVASGYPAELERIVMKALEPDPAARYPTAAAMRADLEAFAPPARRRLSERLRPYQARLAAAALVLVAVWEIAVLLAAKVGAPEDADWRAAAQALAAEHRATDLIVFAPGWIDPVGRRWVGSLMRIEDAARLDDVRYPRVWELSIRGVSSGVTGTVAYDRRFGAVRLRRFERSAPKITWSMGARPQLFEVGFEPHRCVLIVPRAGQPQQTAFDDVELGDELAVAAGLADFRSRRDNTARAILRVLVDGQEVSRGVLGNETGFAPLPPAKTEPGPHQIVFEAAVDPASDPEKTNLHVCVAAEARLW